MIPSITWLNLDLQIGGNQTSRIKELKFPILKGQLLEKLDKMVNNNYILIKSQSHNVARKYILYILIFDL